MSLRGEAVVPMNRGFTSFAMTVSVKKSGCPRFLAKIPKVFHKLFSKCGG